MNEHTKIENQLQYYLEQFTYLHQLVLEDSRHIVDLENLIDEYSQWIQSMDTSTFGRASIFNME